MELLQERGVPVVDADTICDPGDWAKITFATVWNPPPGLLDQVTAVIVSGHEPHCITLTGVCATNWLVKRACHHATATASCGVASNPNNLTCAASAHMLCAAAVVPQPALCDVPWGWR